MSGKCWVKNQVAIFDGRQHTHPCEVSAECSELLSDFERSLILDNHGVGGENFAIADKQGNSIIFDAHPHKNQGNYFREHVTDRHEYAWLADQVIQQPDEIWSYYDVRKGKKLVHTYLKYYNGKTLTVVVSEAEGLLKAETIYEVRSADTFTNLRKGVLLHANKKF